MAYMKAEVYAVNVVITPLESIVNNAKMDTIDLKELSWTALIRVQNVNAMDRVFLIYVSKMYSI